MLIRLTRITNPALPATGGNISPMYVRPETLITAYKFGYQTQQGLIPITYILVSGAGGHYVTEEPEEIAKTLELMESKVKLK